MILIALGSNLPAPPARDPLGTVKAALAALGASGIGVDQVSRWYRSEAQPPSGQPDYVNGVARISTDLPPGALLECMHRIEADFGRARSIANAPRTLDLDLIDWHGRVRGGRPVLPHPRAHLRNFVLLPLAEVAPDWRHPVSRRPVQRLIDDLPAQGPAAPLQAAAESAWN